jgi:hypothetical protein
MKEKIKYEVVSALLEKIGAYALSVNSCEFGLPLAPNHYKDDLIKIVLDHFGMELDECPKVKLIMGMTGGSRKFSRELLSKLEEM